MEITTPTGSSAPASATKSPDSDVNVNGRMERSLQPSPGDHSHTHPDNIIMPAPVAAAPAVHTPKIVQTAFIHKLYNMLEDKAIQHLITWTPPEDSFAVLPNHEFSKVLAQYFKHTNISSFVRQLNMYGFHKVNDVFQQGTGDTTMWEFKHGNGNFRRGDLVGLREIKRRASRHSLVHREYNGQKPPPSQPGTPAEPMPPMQEGGNPQLNTIEHQMYELTARLQRNEENTHYIEARYQAVLETVSRLLQFNRDLCSAVLALAPNPDNPIHRDVSALQADIQRQSNMFRSWEEPHEPLFASPRTTFFSNLDNAPVSPRQMPQDDPRRSNLAVPQSRQANYYRPTVPSNLSISTRRPYGSIGANTTQSSPSSSVRPGSTHAPPPPPPGPHPLANVELPPSSLARRHTSADIRAHGWQPNPPPFASGPPSTQWPSSPNRAAVAEDQRLRDSFSHYSLQPSSQPQSHSRPATPPPPTFSNGAPPADTFGSWSWNSANRGDNKNLSIRDNSAPPTRRGSMAHILNPTDTAERDDEDEMDPRGDDDRKRKRLQ